jgi:two-component system LytT family response regulator
MKPIRTMIVDDEPLARRGIRQLLAPHHDIEVTAEARNGKEAVRLLRTLTPVDLVFLDVQMPELDGFAVLRKLDAERLPSVIFVTAYDTFAVRAFEAHALDYLVKPGHWRVPANYRSCCQPTLSALRSPWLSRTSFSGW